MSGIKSTKNDKYEEAQTISGYDSSTSCESTIFDVDVNAGETVLLEPAYPIVIESTGDQISVGAGTSTVNFFITGDKEA